jgi:hypothetical protein
MRLTVNLSRVGSGGRRMEMDYDIVEGALKMREEL